MKKQLMLIGIITILVTVGLSGCNTSSTPEEKVIGDWISKTYYQGKYINGSDLHYTFYSNSTVVVNHIGNNSKIWYTYIFEGQQLITTDPSGKNSTVDYSFSNDNKELVLSSIEYPTYANFLERQ